MKRSRHEEMEAQAKVYHKKYPIVWQLFCRYTKEVIDRGFKHYGAMAIFQRIRWHQDKPNVDGLSTFKLNNNYVPFYSRWFMDAYPQYKGFFRTREQISKKKNSTNLPELGPGDYWYDKY